VHGAIDIDSEYSSPLFICRLFNRPKKVNARAIDQTIESPKSFRAAQDSGVYLFRRRHITIAGHGLVWRESDSQFPESLNVPVEATNAGALIDKTSDASKTYASRCAGKKEPTISESAAH
jgi:hypothetical protein